MARQGGGGGSEGKGWEGGEREERGGEEDGTTIKHQVIEQVPVSSAPSSAVCTYDTHSAVVLMALKGPEVSGSGFVEDWHRQNKYPTPWIVYK